MIGQGRPAVQDVTPHPRPIQPITAPGVPRTASQSSQDRQHPVAHDGLGLEAFQVPGMAPHRLAGRASRRRSSSPYWANSLSKQEMGPRKPGCRAGGGAPEGMDIMNITTGGYGIENTDASQLCFPTSLDLSQLGPLVPVFSGQKNTRRRSLPPSLAFPIPRRI